MHRNSQTLANKGLSSQQITLSVWSYSFYGTDIDDKLADIVREYNKHAVPLTDMILRLQLISLLQTFERQEDHITVSSPTHWESNLPPCPRGTFLCPGVTVLRPRGIFLCPGVNFLYSY